MHFICRYIHYFTLDISADIKASGGSVWSCSGWGENLDSFCSRITKTSMTDLMPQGVSFMFSDVMVYYAYNANLPTPGCFWSGSFCSAVFDLGWHWTKNTWEQQFPFTFWSSHLENGEQRVWDWFPWPCCKPPSRLQPGLYWVLNTQQFIVEQRDLEKHHVDTKWLFPCGPSQYLKYLYHLPPVNKMATATSAICVFTWLLLDKLTFLEAIYLETEFIFYSFELHIFKTSLKKRHI